ncbi:MAG: YraN family protein [Thermoflavifilum sp.]|nr:YraN family protein [Thermoflavifilum sp.]
MAIHHQIGKQGEALARQYLEEQGYTIVHHNWRDAHREIDIIARKGQLLIFVEVKTRSGYRGGWPEYAIDAKKEADLLLAAQHYLEENPFAGEVRFDVIAIVFDAHTGPHLHHIPDAIQ